MFSVRDRLASDDVVARQKTIWSVVRGDTVSGAADGRLRKMAAAVCGHREIEPVVRLKIYKSLDAVLELLRSAGDEIGPEIKRRVGDLLERTSIDFVGGWRCVRRYWLTRPNRRPLTTLNCLHDALPA